MGFLATSVTRLSSGTKQLTMMRRGFGRITPSSSSSCSSYAPSPLSWSVMMNVPRPCATPSGRGMASKAGARRKKKMQLMGGGKRKRRAPVTLNKLRRQFLKFRAPQLKPPKRIFWRSEDRLDGGDNEKESGGATSSCAYPRAEELLRRHEESAAAFAAGAKGNEITKGMKPSNSLIFRIN